MSSDASFDVPTQPSPPETEAEGRQRALADPGPPWKDWLYFTAFRWWFGIFFLIIDSWIAAEFIELGDWVFLGLALIAAVYLEYLLYLYLWARPEEIRRGRRPRRRWPPFELGRWTPEAMHARATGNVPPVDSSASDPREFL